MQNRIKPFVKWAGGKGNILDKLSKFYPVNLKMGNIECYIEPFIGGGAVMLDILQMYRVNEFFAFDTNIDLINSYNVIKENVEELIDELRKLEENYLCLEKEERKEYYYSIRDKYNLNIIAKNDVSISKASSLIICKYLVSYFFILSVLSSSAFCIYSFVMIFCFSFFAQTEASPTISPISLNCVDNFSLSPASLEANSTTFAIASLSKSNKLS